MMKLLCRYELKNTAGFMESIYAKRTFLVCEVRMCFSLLNSRLRVGADGSGRSCILLDQACIWLIYSVMVKGSRLRARSMASCQTLKAASFP